MPGVTRKELENQNLVFEKSAKSTFKFNNLLSNKMRNDEKL